MFDLRHRWLLVVSSLLLAGLLIYFITPRATVPASVRAAFALRDEIETSNRGDLAYLWAEIRNQSATLGSTEKDAALEAVRQRLASDRLIYAQMRVALLRTSGDPQYELESSLSRLVGAAGANGRTGILEDAEALLAGSFGRAFRDGALDLVQPAGNQITVLKTLLIYLSTILAKENDLGVAVRKRDLLKRVKLLYPARLPKAIETAVGPALLLAAGHDGEVKLYIPNAGYVYGGNFETYTGECHGIDCSALISRCIGSRIRMSTLYQDLLWRDLHGDAGTFNADEQRWHKRFRTESDFDRVKENFTALATDTGLKAGDIVTWRPLGADQRGAHAVICLTAVPGSPGEFVGLSAVRLDDKSREGIEVAVYRTLLPEMRTTILRLVR